MSETSSEPFGREDLLDKPGIVGARWWQRSLEAADPVSRRQAIQAVFVGAGVLLGVSAIGIVASSSSSSDFRYESRPLVDMQKEFGWSFGANGVGLIFDGESKRPFDRATLSHLADDMRPASSAFAPFYVPTLFQSLTATPRSVASEESTHPAPLKDLLVPMATTAMDAAYRQGRALAELLRAVSGLLVIVDLPGPDAVAFAAGASRAFDPVFAFDNWPHPHGVVPAHEVLAAAAYYQPLFAKRAHDPKASPMIVLDRRRLTPYTDDSAHFDNRHLAKVPDAAALRKLKITRVLYVCPDGTTDREVDDLNDDLVLYARAGLDVRLVGADAFSVDPSERAPSTRDDDHPAFYYGGSPASNAWFFHDYEWAPLPAGTAPPRSSLGGPEWRPNPRATPFSSGAPSPTSQRPRPSGFGTVAVVVSMATGLILGARLLRSGSWNRGSSSGGWGG